MFIKDNDKILNEKDYGYNLKTRLFMFKLANILLLTIFFIPFSLVIYIILYLTKEDVLISELFTKTYQQQLLCFNNLNKSLYKELQINKTYQNIKIEINSHNYFSSKNKEIIFNLGFLHKIILMDNYYIETSFFTDKIVSLKDFVIKTSTERRYNNQVFIKDASNISKESRYLHQTKKGERDKRYSNNPLLTFYDFDLERIDIYNANNFFTLLVSNKESITELKKLKGGKNMSIEFAEFNINGDEENNNYSSNYIPEPIPLQRRKNFEENSNKINRILAMEKIPGQIYYAKDDGFNLYSYARVFITQAKFMEDFTDNFEQIYQTDPYQNHYTYLNTNQLRTYFTWRTNTRERNVKITSMSYVSIYIYELINLIGVNSKEEAWDELISFWKEYREQMTDLWIDELMIKIVPDFCACYDMGYDFEQLKRFLPIDVKEKLEKKDKDILEITEKHYENKLKFYNQISSYKVLNSKFYESKYGYLIEESIPYVFLKLDEYFARNNMSFNEIAIGLLKRDNSYKMFDEQHYIEERKYLNIKVKLNSLYDYECINGVWSKKSFKISDSARQVMGLILKEIEIRLRDKTKYGRNLKLNLSNLQELEFVDKNLPKLLNEEFFDLIDNSVDEFLKENTKKIKQKEKEQLKENIKIDKSNFDEIRKSSKRIQDKLVIEEEEIEINKPIPVEETKVEMGSNLLKDSLTDLEKEILNMVIDNKSILEIKDKLKENNILLEVIIESINEKAFDFIGDSILENRELELIIYEDYIDEVKDALGGK